MEHIKGNTTSEHGKSNAVIILSIVLPVVALICDLLVNESIATGTGAIVAGLLSSAIASAGYSSSRGRVKSAEALASAAIDKKKEG